MIRFNNGTPQQMWFSQHSDGEAYYWDVVQKSGIRVGHLLLPCL